MAPTLTSSAPEVLVEFCPLFLAWSFCQATEETQFFLPSHRWSSPKESRKRTLPAGFIQTQNLADEFFGSSGNQQFSPSTLCQLHVAVTLALFRWLAVSINREMALMWCALLNYADFYFCYVIKTLVPSSSECMNKNVTSLPRRTRARYLPPNTNLFPATSIFGRTL